MTMGQKALGFTLALVSLGTTCVPARADEGMWTFDNPPVKLLQQKYEFTPTQAWLDHVRLSCVRLNDGGSGSFVSPHGLLLTNHHVARGQLQKNSTTEHDYIRDGFYAATPEQEMKSPDLEVNVLVSMENVTPRVIGGAPGRQDAGGGVRQTQGGDRRHRAREPAEDRAALRRGDALPGRRILALPLQEIHRRAAGLRARKQQAAFFGGDPDNFTYPRYDLDMALFRVYENGKPIDTQGLSEVESPGRHGRGTGLRVRPPRQHVAPGHAGAARSGARRGRAQRAQDC